MNMLNDVTGADLVYERCPCARSPSDWTSNNPLLLDLQTQMQGLREGFDLTDPQNDFSPGISHAFEKLLKDFTEAKFSA